jgi:hypothetical protein
MPKHKLSKKHIEAEKKLNSDIFDEVIKVAELLKQENPKKNQKQLVIDLYYAIQAQYFDEDGCEILDEADHYVTPETKNEEEKAFCCQHISLISSDLNQLAEETNNIGILPSVLEPIDIRLDKLDFSQRDAKKQALSIFRAYKRAIKEYLGEHVEAVEEQKIPIKTIDEPIVPKSILKKQVQIVEEEEEQLEEFEFYNPFTYAKFLKLTPDHKIDYLESFFDNVSKEMIDSYYELYDNFEKSQTMEEYNLLYRRILYSIETMGQNYEDENNSVEEDEEEEENEDF